MPNNIATDTVSARIPGSDRCHPGARFDGFRPRFLNNRNHP